MIKQIKLNDLHAHPKNPRLAPRDDVIEQIAAQINGCFDEAHALIVRPNASGFEIISGHNRHLAAEKAGLETVPCWVREMSDDDAYMALALCNAQGELHPLEEGMHALGSGMTQRDYAAKAGKGRGMIEPRWQAATVAAACHDIMADLRDHWSAVSALHSSPRWLWRALVSALVANNWTVETARKAAQKLKDVSPLPEWVNSDKVAEAIVSGAMPLADAAGFSSLHEKSVASITKSVEDADRFIAEITKHLIDRHPSKLSEVSEICLAVEQEQAALIRERQQADLLRTKRDEEVKARISRLQRNVSLEEWKALEADERAALLDIKFAENVGFNKQENDSIEWAQWSWNPVTGCLHDCPYCYARDIANSSRMAKAYPNGFAPTFRPSMLLAPQSMKVPLEGKKDTRYRNVFTCSMADLFGRWVPREWIESVLSEIRNAPNWNFLCLTKFPKRMAEFDIPPNAWMGTTVDLQARVANAEAAFEKIKAGVRWLSIEPMIEPLKFKNLDRFDWIVVGGSSRSSQTPDWYPPFEWVEDLVAQARAAGCKIYFKTNLGMKKRLLELPFEAPIPSDNTPAPKEFHYLGKAKSVE